MKYELTLTPQTEAENIVALAAWVETETQFFRMLLEAGCSDAEAKMCMQEVN